MELKKEGPKTCEELSKKYNKETILVSVDVCRIDDELGMMEFTISKEEMIHEYVDLLEEINKDPKMAFFKYADLMHNSMKSSINVTKEYFKEKK